jgi:hypothetical protein
MTDWGVRRSIYPNAIRIIAKFLEFMLLEDSIVPRRDIKTHKFPEF